MARVRYHRASGLPMHDDGIRWRVLGALPPRPQVNLPMFGDTFTVIPESQWHDCSIKHWNTPVWNQGSHGSCVGQATVAAFTYSWHISGQQSHEFSPTSIYARINNGRDQGAVVADGLDALKQYGTCLMSQFGQDFIYESQLSPAAKATGKRFRALEGYKINTFAELGTALMRGLAVVSGIGIGNNFSKLDRDGVCPLPDRVIGGHALCHIGLKKLNGVWVVESKNSWSTRWGHAGYCYLQPDAWHANFGFPFDAFAISGVLDDPQETVTDQPVLT